MQYHSVTLYYKQIYSLLEYLFHLIRTRSTLSSLHRHQFLLSTNKYMCWSNDNDTSIYYTYMYVYTSISFDQLKYLISSLFETFGY